MHADSTPSGERCPAGTPARLERSALDELDGDAADREVPVVVLGGTGEDQPRDAGRALVVQVQRHVAGEGEVGPAGAVAGVADVDGDELRPAAGRSAPALDVEAVF